MCRLKGTSNLRAREAVLNVEPLQKPLEGTLGNDRGSVGAENEKLTASFANIEPIIEGGGEKAEYRGEEEA